MSPIKDIAKSLSDLDTLIQSPLALLPHQEFAEKLRFNFEEDLKDCYKLRLEDLKNRPWYVKVLSSIARLIAPIL